MLRLRRSILSAVLAGVSPIIVLAAFAPSALASTASHQSPTSTSLTAAASSSTLDPGDTTETGTGILPPADVPAYILSAAASDGAVPSASQSCETVYVWDRLTDALGIQLAKFQINTYYCWNGSIVTSHSTWETNSSNGTLGWSYKGLLQNQFHCYYANDNKCSGNYEQLQGNFSGPFSQHWQPTCWLEEIYTGGFSGACSG